MVQRADGEIKCATKNYPRSYWLARSGGNALGLDWITSSRAVRSRLQVLGLGLGDGHGLNTEHVWSSGVSGQIPSSASQFRRARVGLRVVTRIGSKSWVGSLERKRGTDGYSDHERLNSGDDFCLAEKWAKGHIQFTRRRERRCSS